MKAWLTRWRLWLPAAFIGLALSLVVGKLFYIQVLKADTLQALAARAYRGSARTEVPRGEIVDRGGEVLAISIPAVSLYVHPSRLSAVDAEALCAELRSAALGDRCTALRGDANYAWIARQLPSEGRKALIERFRRTPGAGVHEGWTRTYPKSTLAGQLIGFTGVDGQGLEGLERTLEEALSPEARTTEVFRDARRRFLLDPEDLEAMLPRRRAVELTIDITTQALVEQSLGAAIARQRGKAGVALVAELATGGIRAAAVWPSFDPNHFGDYGPADWRPRFATDTYEPGSTVKPLVLAATLMAGRSLHEVVYAEQGKYKVDEHTIKDTEPHAWLSLRNVVVRSSNIGMVKMGDMLGREGLFDLYSRLGFGQRLDVGMPSEARGILRPISRWSALDWATQTFGQGLSVSPLHLLHAYTVVAGKGRAIPLHVVERVLDAETGVTIRGADHQPVEVFAGAEAAFGTVHDVMRAVVSEGTGRRAQVEGLTIAGKTGTAQKPDLERGGYKEGAYVAWFAGFFPAENPRWVAVVLVDEPEVSIYGGEVAAPVFRDVAEVIAIRHGLLGASNLAWIGAAGALPNAQPVALPSLTDGRMPDLRGLSLRDVGRLAQAHGSRIVPKGSGLVVDQQPAPGVKLPAGADWHLTLRGGVDT
jgi:cell division protein FtsI (penicillin-binding protein 3)